MRNKSLLLVTKSYMMRTMYFLLATVMLFSCGDNKAKRVEALHFYNSVNNEMIANKPVQEEFLAKLKEAILSLKEDPSAVADAAQLLAMLDSARMKNINHEKSINELAEFDDDIKYKQISLDYLATFSKAYKPAFADVIKIMGETGSERFEKVSTILKPVLQEIREKQTAFEEAQAMFKAKYFDHNGEGVRTGSNYEYVKLKDLKYNITKLPDSTKISLLSYSGGEDTATNGIYYKQLIGINESTGDTVRILAMSVMQDYDFEKAPRDGIFLNMGIGDEAKDADGQFVIFNTDQKEDESREYKTAFGLVIFEGQQAEILKP